MLSVAALLAASVLFLSPGPTATVALDIPYRSQWDGSPYAGANCGPTSLAMVLAYFGQDVSPWHTRIRAMQAQGSWVDDPGGYSDDYGVFIHYLAAVAQSYGLRVDGLWDREGAKTDRLHAWQPNELRRAIVAGHPVIVQVQYRALPGREGSTYFSDHYMVVHGLQGADFVYSDPSDRGGGGPAQVISEEALFRAMSLSTAPRAAFAVYAPR